MIGIADQRGSRFDGFKASSEPDVDAEAQAMEE